MKLLRRCWTAFLLLGCVHARDQRLPTVPRMIPLVTRKVHVDINYSPAEFADIARAAELLDHETRGRLRVMLLQDWYPGLWLPKDHWKLIRLAPDEPITVNFDAAQKSNVWGMCYHGNQSMYLVPERIHGNNAFVSVLEHEILHSVNVEHVKDPKSIMARYVDTSPLEFSPEDRKAFCEALGCDTKEVWK